MIQTVLSALARNPRLWALLRRLVEANYAAERAAIAAELAPLLEPQTRRFLDFGCGTGEFAGSFPVRSYIGIDVSLPYVRYAATQSAAFFGIMDGQALGLGSETIDGVLITGVLHHLDDQAVREALAEVHRVLTPAGTVLVMEDIPPPSIWNVPGHIMHWADRGDAIRSYEDYQKLFTPWFHIERAWNIRSGICDYGVYRLARVYAPTTHADSSF